MKKVLTNACRMLMASAVAIVMLTGMKSAANAANDTVVIAAKNYRDEDIHLNELPMLEGDKWLDKAVEIFKVAKPMMDFMNAVIDDYE